MSNPHFLGQSTEHPQKLIQAVELAKALSLSMWELILFDHLYDRLERCGWWWDEFSEVWRNQSQEPGEKDGSKQT